MGQHSGTGNGATPHCNADYKPRHKRELTRQERIWLLALYFNITEAEARQMMESVDE